MNRAIRKCWRDSASLIVLAKRLGEPPTSVCFAGGNYDILLQTRTSRASFPNSVVFPGGVCEAADGADRWLQHFASFGYSQSDFDALHRAGSPVTPIFADNPVQRHVALRITAIRETFEELGLLLCSTQHKDKRDSVWASVLKDVDVKYWQSQTGKRAEGPPDGKWSPPPMSIYDTPLRHECLPAFKCPRSPLFSRNSINYHFTAALLRRVVATQSKRSDQHDRILRGLTLISKDQTLHEEEPDARTSSVNQQGDRIQVTKDPQELYNLCKEYNCYPDLWALHYWSNWLTPARAPKRFDTAFFITAFETKPTSIENNSEVVNTEWASPSNVIDRSTRKEVLLYPPQIYELNRLDCFSDIDDLIRFAKDRSCLGNELFYPITVRAKDGILHLLPGDHLYPATVDYYHTSIKKSNSYVEELCEEKLPVHRFVCQDTLVKLVTRNHIPVNHINMGDKVIPVNLMIH